MNFDPQVKRKVPEEDEDDEKKPRAETPQYIDEDVSGMVPSRQPAVIISQRCIKAMLKTTCDGWGLIGIYVFQF